MFEQMECFLCPAYGIRAHDINNGLCFDSKHPLISEWGSWICIPRQSKIKKSNKG